MYQAIDFNALSTYDDKSGDLNAIIETPKGFRNKYSYDEELRLFKLKSMMPAGASFPYDFGFLPRTLGEDGDPIDILVLMEEAAFPGCLVHCRLVGVIEAEQTEKDGKKDRNDRLVAVATQSPLFKNINAIEDLPSTLLDQIEHFFISYNQMKGRHFKVLERTGPRKAKKLIKEGIKKFKEKKK